MIKIKKKGFTLIELIIVIAISSIIIGTVHVIFMSGMKVFNDTNLKTDLQMEGQMVQQEISNEVMNAKGIKKIDTVGFGVIDFESGSNQAQINSIKDRLVEVNSITFVIPEEVEENGNKIIKERDVTFVVDGNEFECNNKILTSSINEDTDKKIKVKYFDGPNIQFEVNLKKEKNNIKVEYPINVDVKFRNVDSALS